MCLAGDKMGNLGFWDISDSIERFPSNSDDGTTGVGDQEEFVPHVATFKPFNNKPISKIVFNPANLNQVFLSSYDASLRLMDIETSTFKELYVHPDEEMISHFDVEKSSNFQTIWFSDGFGSAGMVDLRIPRNDECVQFLTLSEKKINTIHINPIHSHYMVVAGLDRTAKIFDLRKIDRQAHDALIEPLQVLEHRLSVNCAYWDPKGNDILSTSFDDTLGLWKDVIEKDRSGLISIKHDNNTGEMIISFKSLSLSLKLKHLKTSSSSHPGRWVQKFKAVWRGQDLCSTITPSSEKSAIVVGNMKRIVDIYSGDKGRPLATLTDVSLTAIPAINVWHPTLNVIVSGNASGRMNVWK